MAPRASKSVHASFPSEQLTVGAGAAIFHLATQRVVVCYHSRDHYWFLPKGRRNAGEATARAAEREAFEESGYRNRLLPLPLRHCQPEPEVDVVRAEGGGRQLAGHRPFVVEPLWTQLLPLTTTRQYLLFWFVAETLPRRVENSVEELAGETSGGLRAYVEPPSFPQEQTLRQRIAFDCVVGEDGRQHIYEPVHHEGTGVNEDETHYRSFLLPIEEAKQKLKGSVMEDVVRRGWQAIELRMEIEAKNRG